MQHLLIAIALFTAACGSSAANRPANTTPNATASTGAESDLVCKEEMRTGSVLPPRRICRSQNEIDNDRRFIQDTILVPSSRPLFTPLPVTDPRFRNGAGR